MSIVRGQSWWLAHTPWLWNWFRMNLHPLQKECHPLWLHDSQHSLHNWLRGGLLEAGPREHHVVNGQRHSKCKPEWLTLSFPKCLCLRLPYKALTMIPGFILWLSSVRHECSSPLESGLCSPGLGASLLGQWLHLHLECLRALESVKVWQQRGTCPAFKSTAEWVLTWGGKWPLGFSEETKEVWRESSGRLPRGSNSERVLKIRGRRDSWILATTWVTISEEWVTWDLTKQRRVCRNLGWSQANGTPRTTGPQYTLLTHVSLSWTPDWWEP